MKSSDWDIIGWLLLPIGMFIFFDGVLSIWFFLDQEFYIHFGRIVRLICGIILVAVSGKLLFFSD